MRTDVMRTFIAALAVALSAPLADAHGDAHGKPVAAQPIVETGFGRTGDPARVSRTVDIDMSDAMRFTPAELVVNRGETVRFVVRNNGKTLHEMVLGSWSELQAHAELMRKFPDMEHDEPYMAHVAPRKTADIVWQFTRSGVFHYGCLVPGHFEAGMAGKVTVR
jgi:uncharacterized cupredoxin-like copper-binding protein